MADVLSPSILPVGYSLPTNAGTNFLQPPQQLTIAARRSTRVARAPGLTFISCAGDREEDPSRALPIERLREDDAKNDDKEPDDEFDDLHFLLADRILVHGILASEIETSSMK
jgi:hypothetical protein